jgi:hypothetical protein
MLSIRPHDVGGFHTIAGRPSGLNRVCGLAAADASLVGAPRRILPEQMGKHRKCRATGPLFRAFAIVCDDSTYRFVRYGNNAVHAAAGPDSLQWRVSLSAFLRCLTSRLRIVTAALSKLDLSHREQGCCEAPYRRRLCRNVNRRGLSKKDAHYDMRKDHGLHR